MKKTILAAGLVLTALIGATVIASSSFIALAAPPAGKGKPTTAGDIIYAECKPSTDTSIQTQVVPPHSSIIVVCGAFGDNPIFGLRNNDFVVATLHNDGNDNLILVDADTDFDFAPDEDASVQFTIRNLSDVDQSIGGLSIDFIAWHR